MPIQRKRRVTKKNVGDEDRVVTRARVDRRETRQMATDEIQQMGRVEPATTSTSDQNQLQDEGVAEEEALVGVDYKSLSLSQLRLKIQPFEIVGSGKMKREELLQLCHLFCPEKNQHSETGQRAVTRLQARENYNQGNLATQSPECEDSSNRSVDVIHGSRRGSSRHSRRSASPERGSLMDTQNVQESGRHRKRSSRKISNTYEDEESETDVQESGRHTKRSSRKISNTDKDGGSDTDEQESGPHKKISSRKISNTYEDEESDTGSGFPLNHITPANRRLTNRSELGSLRESHKGSAMMDFPSRERGTALPRPHPTVLNSKDKGKQRAVSDSDSDYEPEEEEIREASDEDNIDEPDEDDVDDPDGDPMSQDESSKEMSHDIDQILEDLNIPDVDAHSSGSNAMSDHEESDRFKRIENSQQQTNRNVAQIATAVREIAEVVKKMKHDLSSGSGGRVRGGTQAKKPQGGDFLRRIRSHIWTLMGLKNEGRLPPSASEQERSRWKRKIPKNFVNSDLDLNESDQVDGERDPRFPYRGGPGGEDANPQVLLIMWKMMNSVGVKSFRPIWEEKMSSSENKFLWQLATAIFLRLVQCGEYDDVTNFEAKSSVVYAALTKHARQRLQRSFREYNSMSRAELEARHKEGVRHSRLNVWKNRRCATATALDGMWKLCPLIKAASSDDETDEDEEISAEKQKRCKVLRLPWRSAALEDLLVRLDAYQDRKKKESPKGTRGAKPRIRIREDDEDRKESKISPPEGLPIDCYSPEWLSTLGPEELEELCIDEEPTLKSFQRKARVLGV